MERRDFWRDHRRLEVDLQLQREIQRRYCVLHYPWCFQHIYGLVSSVASKYMIDIITGYETSKLWLMIAVMVGSTAFSLTFNSIISRITTKLSIDINNDIQADIFDKIVDADWLSLNQYSNGDILNRFNGDIGTVSGNAISWLPTIIIAVYNFIATFFVILHYDWIMAVIALASAPFLLLMSRFMIKKQRDYSKKVREMSSDLMTLRWRRSITSIPLNPSVWRPITARKCAGGRVNSGISASNTICFLSRQAFS